MEGEEEGRRKSRRGSSETRRGRVVNEAEFDVVEPLNGFGEVGRGGM